MVVVAVVVSSGEGRFLALPYISMCLRENFFLALSKVLMMRLSESPLVSPEGGVTGEVRAGQAVTVSPAGTRLILSLGGGQLGRGASGPADGQISGGGGLFSACCGAPPLRI